MHGAGYGSVPVRGEYGHAMWQSVGSPANGELPDFIPRDAPVPSELRDAKRQLRRNRVLQMAVTSSLPGKHQLLSKHASSQQGSHSSYVSSDTLDVIQKSVAKCMSPRRQSTAEDERYLFAIAKKGGASSFCAYRIRNQNADK